MLAFVAILTMLVALLDIWAIDRTVDRAAQFQDAGAYVLRVRLENEIGERTPIDTADCRSLQIPGVVSSGLVFRLGELRLENAPGFSFAAVASEPGALRIITPAIARTPIGNSDSRIDALGVAGSALVAELLLDEATVVAVENVGRTLMLRAESVRQGPFDRSLLVPRAMIPRGDECWIETEPGQFDDVQAAVGAAFTTVDSDVLVSRLLDSGEFTFEPVGELQSRPTRYLAAAGAAIVALLVALQLRGRRSDIGLYTTLAASKSAVVVIFWAEFALSIVVGSAIGLAWAFWYAATLMGAHTASVALGVRPVALSVFAMLAVTLLQVAIRRPEAPIDLLKDR